MTDEPTVTVTGASLRLAAATLFVLGGITLVATLIFTNTPDALTTGVWWAGSCFGLPAAAAWAAAYWLEMRSVRSNAGGAVER